MILDTTTKTIRVVLGEAKTTNDCDLTASYADQTGAGFLPGNSDSVTNGLTPVTLVTAPGSQVQRSVQEITFHNNDTVTHSVIFQLNDNGTIRVFRQSDVPSGGDFVYSPGNGGVSEVEPAVLLESGTIGAKISALPAFNLTLPPVGTEKMPVVEGGATDAITLAQLFELFVNWLNYVATNPLAAPTVSSNGGAISLVGGAGGATSGDGGGVALTGGAGTTSGNGGAIVLTSGAAAGGGHSSGDVEMTPGTASGGATQGNVKFGAASAWSANGAIATAVTGVGPTGSHTTVQEWLTVKNSSGVIRYIPAF